MPAKSLEDCSQEQIDRMAEMYQAIITNPETREMALRATKIVNPKLAIPELDSKVAIEAAVKPVQERLDAMVADKLRQEAEDRVHTARKNLKAQGYSDEDVTAIEKVMVDDKIASHETAAKFYSAQQRLADSTPGTIARSTLNYTLPESPLKALKAGNKALGP